MKHPLIMANWKLNGSLNSTKELLNGFQQIPNLDELDLVVCPATIHLSTAQNTLINSSITLGAQDISNQSQGAFTGETSAVMAAELGVKYSLLGHSERRHIYGESDEIIEQKYNQAQQANITPVLCIGETKEQNRTKNTFTTVHNQLKCVINNHKNNKNNEFVIAYEPVWSIGTGLTPDTETIAQTHEFIRTCLDKHQIKAKAILYGGSVSGNNASEILAIDNVDGLLVGGASLKIEEFTQICQAANAA